jgi:uncharacterized protein
MAGIMQSAVSPQRDRYLHSGDETQLIPIDIDHQTYAAVVNPATAFWALVDKDKLPGVLTDGALPQAYTEKCAGFTEEMNTLRFGLKPSAVYVNPTERCNLDCSYCYIPAAMRRSGSHMAADKLLEALARLKTWFGTYMDAGRRPQIIFHGAEPLLNKDAMVEAITAFGNDFGFGVQTNGTALDDAMLNFLTANEVSIGLSLDGPNAGVTDKTRRTWGGKSVHATVLALIDKLRGYPGYSVIATGTAGNMMHLQQLVELFHQLEVPACMLNQLRCTLPGARAIRPQDAAFSGHFIAALDRSYELYRETGRKLVVANFANILLAILAPTARRLMCDISPCGGGRAFFALGPEGDLFPCSEFIGLEKFNGGNLFRDDLGSVLQSAAFRLVTERNVDTFAPCSQCVIRHYCGAPCPAEAHEMHGGMDHPGAFCEFYEAQVAFAFRQIADGKADAFLWNGWDEGVETTMDLVVS